MLLIALVAPEYPPRGIERDIPIEHDDLFNLNLQQELLPDHGDFVYGFSEDDGTSRGHEQCAALRALNLTNKQVAKEVRTFFFANNHFEIWPLTTPTPLEAYDYPQGIMQDQTHSNLFYFNAPTRSLRNIGAVGRGALTALSLKDTREGVWPECHYDYTEHNLLQIVAFFRLLRQCSNLQMLDIHNILSFTPEHIDQYIEGTYTSRLRFTPMDCCTVGFFRLYGGQGKKSDEEERYREIMAELPDAMGKVLEAKVEIVDTQKLPNGHAEAVAAMEAYRLFAEPPTELNFKSPNFSLGLSDIYSQPTTETTTSMSAPQLGGRTGPQAPHKKRLTFTSLPAEICNQIYALTLVQEQPIKVVTNACGKVFIVLAHISNQVKQEAETFFYAHNEFEVEVSYQSGLTIDTMSSIDDGDFLRRSTNFLTYIGASGRASLKALKLADSNGEALHRAIMATNPGLVTAFLNLLTQCRNLEKLEINNVLAVMPASVQ
ncbi:hypothetical protein BU23DRAFT_628789 [Bimuria novae-zelandiae CBS 107.79]|uniref:Uncharacterized protein n=1 Tax=Bimuria novae-zelandiae CBS 107.79 TaxID=1447943 RepID=A0A6A5UN67_9PLEO|nr:hypothetical protein BU23DRAFT_628789 [Bimuria novae-zelandiae CBS 107.79]